MSFELAPATTVKIPCEFGMAESFSRSHNYRSVLWQMLHVPGLTADKVGF